MKLLKTLGLVFIFIFAVSLMVCEKKKEQKVSNAESKESESKVNKTDWKKSFDVEPEKFTTTGENDHFILKPGYKLTLQGEENGKNVVLTITVLNETKIIDGFETRVVEEKESREGKLVEISRNYFALDKGNNDIYYFGEMVDIYKDSKIVSHEGAWESGKEGAKLGLMIPAKIEVGKKYYQEIAPNLAMDRAEIISNSETLETPAGKFENCLKIEETTPLEPGVKEYKIYAPGIGLIKDGSLLLVKYGFQKKY